MTVITFPNTPLVNEDTKPKAVVVAPLGRTVVAWVETDRGWVILERTPDQEHAFADGYAYAERHDLPLRYQNRPHDTARPYPEAERGGTLTVTPSGRHGGSWDVIHVSASGDATSMLANRFALGQAEAEGRRLAAAMGAVFKRSQVGAGE